MANRLAEKDGGTEVMITQNNNASEEEKKHSEQNWQQTLDGLKKMLES